jgi:hydrogenase maturation protease
MPLVVAWGNPGRRDDGVAWEVARALAGDPGVDVTCVHQLGPELAEVVSRADGVLFVDAAQGEDAGRIEVAAVEPRWESPILAHCAGPAGLLDLAVRLYGRAPRAFLETVTGADFGFGPGLSPPVAAALPSACRHARAALARLGA